MSISDNIDNLVEGVIYHTEYGAAYILTHCVDCGKPKTSTLLRGKIQYPRCSYCSNHSKEARERMSRTFKGRSKTVEQIEKLREASRGNKNSVGRHPSQETKDKISQKLKGKPISEKAKESRAKSTYKPKPKSLETRQKLSKALKGRKPSENTLKAASEYHKGRPTSDKQKEVTSKIKKANWDDPIKRQNIINNMKLSCNTEEFKNKSSKNVKKVWDSYTIEEKNERIMKTIISANRKPNKQEIKLMELINIACPNEYEFTGNGTMAIGGKIPDYTNINGKKKVIEMFGIYFHSPEMFKGKKVIKWHRTPEGCIETYKKYGFDCLIIWDSDMEIKNDDEIISIIKEFNYGRR